MAGQKILKVTSILMIIGGVIAAVAGVVAFLGISTFAALAESTEGMGFIYAGSIIVIAASVIEFIAGIKGVGACSDPQKAASCIKWGLFIAGMTVGSAVIGLIGGGKLNIIGLVQNLLLPGLYVYGAMQMRDNIYLNSASERNEG